MFVATIEIWPYGSISNGYTVYKMAAANDGTGTPERGNYKGWDVSDILVAQEVWGYVAGNYDDPDVTVKNFPRGRNQHHLAALTLALMEGLGWNEIAVKGEADAVHSQQDPE